MRKKIHNLVIKIMNMDINPYQVLVYYNVYMIKLVFFGYRVIELHRKEENELKRIYKESILIKIGFSWKFLQTVMCTRKSTLKIDLMIPNTIIKMLKLKLYIGNKWNEGNTGEAIKAQEEYQ